MSRLRRSLLAGLLVLAGLVWLRINEKIEGRVLLTITADHGLTTSDLLSLAAFAAALVLIWPDRRSR